MKFKHSAFIENAPEVKEWLELLEYTVNGIEDCTKYILTMPARGLALIVDNPNVPPIIFNCLGNLSLFKAISALRDDSDYMQWFTDGKEFILCDREDWIDMISTLCCGGNYNYDKNGELSNLFHKATINELIEHFKKGE